MFLLWTKLKTFAVFAPLKYDFSLLLRNLSFQWLLLKLLHKREEWVRVILLWVFLYFAWGLRKYGWIIMIELDMMMTMLQTITLNHDVKHLIKDSDRSWNVIIYVSNNILFKDIKKTAEWHINLLIGFCNDMIKTKK